MTIRLREYVPTIHPSIVLRKRPAPPPRLIRDRADRAVLVDGGHQTAAIERSEALRARHTNPKRVLHDWAKRRTAVIAQFKASILPEITPVGFTTPLKPFERAIGRLSEIDHIDRTCEQELAPEWLTLRANGLRGESLDRLISTEDDSYTLADLVVDNGYNDLDLAEGTELLGGMRRVEAFLKEQDEQNWYSGKPRRYFVAVDGNARVGFVPLFNAYRPDLQAKDVRLMSAHLPSTDDIIWASKHRVAHRIANTDATWRWAWAPEAFAKRDTDAATQARALYYAHDEWEAERDAEADTDFDEEEMEYKPSTPCPNPQCTERGDDCRLCFGSRYIQHTLGLDNEADWPPPGWLADPRSRYSNATR